MYVDDNHVYPYLMGLGTYQGSGAYPGTFVKGDSASSPPISDFQVIVPSELVAITDSRTDMAFSERPHPTFLGI